MTARLGIQSSNSTPMIRVLARLRTVLAVALLVGVAGASAIPMGIVMATSGVAAMVIGRTITRVRS